jgi:nucleoside-diphosphate-sugar epimerase
VQVIGVTGARGIIGRRFVEIAITQNRIVSAFAGDIRDLAAVQVWIETERPEAIVHCAALVDVGLAEADPHAAYAVNVGGTLNLLAALRGAQQKVWFFYASSSHVYADSSEPIRESHLKDPRNVYALTKHLGEETSAYFSRTGSIELCIGRIFSIYDKEQTGLYLYPATATRLASHDLRKPFAVRDGHAIRDFSTASDIAAAIYGLMERRANGTINIGSGIGRAVIDQLAILFGDGISFVPDTSSPISAIVADITKLKGIIG